MTLRRAAVRRGISLVEVLTAVVMFGVFLTLAATTLVRCYRNYVSNRDVAVSFRNASIALDKMAAELGQCRQVYAPDPAGAFAPGQTVTPTPGAPFVFAYQQPELGVNGVNGNTPLPPMTAVGYQLRHLDPTDPTRNVLERLLYAPGTDPMSGAPVAVQTAASPVMSFTVQDIPRGDARNGLCIRADAQVQTQSRILPIFFQVHVFDIKDGM